MFRFAGIGSYRFAPSEDLAKRLLGIGFKHLIFSLPSGNTEQTMDDLDARAELAKKLHSVMA